MINITINGKSLSVSEGKTILEAAREAGIVIPTLCYLKELNEVGACRVCVVEVKGSERLVAACNTKVAEGMEIETASARVMEARKHNLQLILSAHDCNCLTCERNGICRLQLLAQQMGLMERQPYPVRIAKDKWDAALPLQRKNSRCISCLRCVSVCDRMMTVFFESRTAARNFCVSSRSLSAETGQCVIHCPQNVQLTSGTVFPSRTATFARLPSPSKSQTFMPCILSQTLTHLRHEMHREFFR